MDFFPDVLDWLGRRPREYGAVQIFVESVPRSRTGHALASIWLQAAFAQPIEGLLKVATSPAGVSVFEGPLPSLANGRVVRWNLPLEIAAGVNELCFCVTAPRVPGAERIRPCWLEAPKLIRPQSDGPGFDYARHAFDESVGALADAVGLGMPATAAMMLLRGTADDEEVVSQPIGLPHKAMRAGFLSAVVEVPLGQPGQQHQELIWAPGRPMPTAPL